MSITQSRISELKHALSDERCGLFFLAGFDEAQSGGGSGVLTVHIAEDTVSDDQLDHVAESIREIDPALTVRILSHAHGDLYAPDSLEAFAGAFEHDQVLADPTGAFLRGAELLNCARALRNELGSSIDRILWRTADSVVVIVAAPSATRAGPSGVPVANEKLSDQVDALFLRTLSGDTGKIVKSALVVAQETSGRYVPIDAASVAVIHKPSRPAGLLARIAGVAALLGLGTVAAAANTTANDVRTPGITALAGLTTLGENSIGVRNHYQAVGGLRLYFGVSSIFFPGASGLEPLRSKQPRERLIDVAC